MNINETYMQWAEVCQVVNRSKPTIWRWVQKGAFPKPCYRKIDGLLLGFKRSDIKYYCENGEPPTL